MDPSLIPFNALIVGPTSSGKSQFVVDQLYGPFRGKFDNIVLICPTFVYNTTFHRIGERDPRMFVINCEHYYVEKWLKIVKIAFEGANTLIIVDDCAASKDVKGATGELVNLAYCARPIGISVWVVTQKYTVIAKDFRQNSAALVLFYTPDYDTMKEVLRCWTGEISHDEYKGLTSKLKERKFSHLVFSSRHPFGVKLFEPKK